MNFKLKPLKKRGQVGLDTAKTVMVSLLILGVLAFALIIAMNQLNTSSLATNQTTGIFNNISDGVSTFFGNAGSWFGLLAIVVIILIIVIVVFAVNRLNTRQGLG